MKELTKEDILELLKKNKKYKFHSIVLLIFIATFLLQRF